MQTLQPLTIKRSRRPVSQKSEKMSQKTERMSQKMENVSKIGKNVSKNGLLSQKMEWPVWKVSSDKSSTR